MHDTQFAVPLSKRHRLASSHRWDGASQVLKLVEDPATDAAPYRVSGFDSGGVGLISTAPDYLRFLEMLRKGGSHGGERILSPKLVKYMSQDHLPAAITELNIGPDHDRSLGLGGCHDPAIFIPLEAKG